MFCFFCFSVIFVPCLILSVVFVYGSLFILFFMCCLFWLLLVFRPFLLGLHPCVLNTVVGVLLFAVVSSGIAERGHTCPHSSGTSSITWLPIYGNRKSPLLVLVFEGGVGCYGFPFLFCFYRSVESFFFFFFSLPLYWSLCTSSVEFRRVHHRK